MRVLGLLLVVSVPASAQFYRVPTPVPAPLLTTAPSTRGTASTIGRVLSDIHAGARSGQLSHKQAKELRREADEISQLESRYAVDGLSDSELAELRTREDVLRALVDAKRSHLIK